MRQRKADRAKANALGFDEITDTRTAQQHLRAVMDLEAKRNSIEYQRMLICAIARGVDVLLTQANSKEQER